MNKISLTDSIFIERNLPKPSKNVYPSYTLSDRIGYDTNIDKLSLHVKFFQRTEFWDEVNILERLYYKNKNQHRVTGYFRRVAEVIN